MRIFGLILAGGEGRRMGGADKALIPLANRPLLAHCIDRFAPQVESLALSANGDPGRFATFGLPVLTDDPAFARLGPLSGVLAGLRWATPLGATALVTVAVDTPFLPCDLVPRLCLAAGNGAAIAASGGRPHPTFALWPMEIAPALQAFLASGQSPRLMAFASAQGAGTAAFSDDGSFDNLNTIEDLARAEALLT